MRVIGFGDQVVDKYENERIMYPGGNALNIAVFAKKLGVEAAFLGAFGNDKEAECVRKAAIACQIEIDHCRFYKGENGCARVCLENGDRRFLGSNRCGVLRTEGLRLKEADYQYLLTFDLIHSSVFSYTENDLKILHENGATISFDFSDRATSDYLEKVLPYIDYPVFSCSHMEYMDMELLMKKVVDMGCKLILCTRGSEGAWIASKNGIYRQEPHLVAAKDTMAAGDSFLTCFLIRYLEGKENNKEEEKSILEALRAAADFAAEQCMIDGSFGYGCKY